MDGMRERDRATLAPEFHQDDWEDYCPECGRAWQAVATTNSGQAASVSWWSWVLVVAGIYLLAAYGPRAWTPGAVLSVTPSFPQVVGCWLAVTEQEYTDCDPTKARIAVALGLAWSLVGLGATVRGAVPRTTPRHRAGNAEVVDPGRGYPAPLAFFAWRIWSLAETTCLSLFALLVMLGGYVGLSRLGDGVPPSAALVAQAIDRVLGVVALTLPDLH